jgi:hypothetical protein
MYVDRHYASEVVVGLLWSEVVVVLLASKTTIPRADTETVIVPGLGGDNTTVGVIDIPGATATAAVDAAGTVTAAPD